MKPRARRPPVARFNGAARLRARNGHDRRAPRSCRHSFNGAARLRARNDRPPAEKALFVGASTEPRGFARGMWAMIRTPPFLKSLQRSRAASRAECGTGRGRFAPEHGASTEPRGFARGMQRDWLRRVIDKRASTEPRGFARGMAFTPAPTPRSAELQRSRAASRAECCRLFTAPLWMKLLQRSRAASRAEWTLALVCKSRRSPLQRSRAASRAECSERRPKPTRRRHRFNGAARLRARNAGRDALASDFDARFNGAARLRARNVGKVARVVVHDPASTEPRGFARGMCCSGVGACPVTAASTEPRGFARGMWRPGEADLARSTGFNGAARLRARNGGFDFRRLLGIPLQRSRAASRAECAFFPIGSRTEKRFNGAARLRARNGEQFFAARLRLWRLQRSRAASRAE